MSISDRDEYITRTTLEWARRVMDAGDLDLPGLVGLVFHTVLSQAPPGAMTTDEGQTLMVQLLSAAAMVFINNGASYSDASLVYRSVADALATLGGPTIGFLDASSVAGPLPPGTN